MNLKSDDATSGWRASLPTAPPMLIDNRIMNIIFTKPSQKELDAFHVKSVYSEHILIVTIES